ncbi:small membrane protein [Erwinia sp. S43]|nr:MULTISPECIES: small membrane protein [Erwiniaceae]MBK0000307.1 small membrane protein [Erwinia sp. S38]MBK0031723.1 small membrane protein [Erwinia sp. S43]MCW1877642.1 small membrane protein [Erwinia sp. INIA01]
MKEWLLLTFAILLLAISIYCLISYLRERKSSKFPSNRKNR